MHVQAREQSSQVWRFILDREVEAPARFCAIQTHRATIAIMHQQVSLRSACVIMILPAKGFAAGRAPDGGLRDGIRSSSVPLLHMSFLHDLAPHSVPYVNYPVLPENQSPQSSSEFNDRGDFPWSGKGATSLSHGGPGRPRGSEQLITVLHRHAARLSLGSLAPWASACSCNA